LLRRFSSFLLFLAALGFIGFFVALFGVRYFGEQGEVSQVFGHAKPVALAGGNYIGVYNVAITPKGKIAETCDLVAWTSAPYVNLLDHQVWFGPVTDPVIAYEESPKIRALMWAALGAGFFCLVISVVLWKKKD
jgi:hypothetical protein